MLIRILILSTLLSGVAFYTGYRALPVIPVSLSGSPGPWMVLAGGFLLLPPLVYLKFKRGSYRALQAIAWLSFSALGLVSILFCLFFAADLGRLAVEAATAFSTWIGIYNPGDTGGINQTQLYTLTLVLGLTVFALGFWNVFLPPKIKKVKMEYENLPEELKGLRIVQISDVHIGPTIQSKFLAKVVKQINRLEPDLVAITGDLIDGSPRELRHHLTPLRKIRAKFGVFFVTGNHEYYNGADAWVKIIEDLGITVLMNNHQIITLGKSRVMIAGVSDYSMRHTRGIHKSDPQQASRSPHPAHFKILLAHQPRTAFEAAQAGFDLQLSGHTHGGQFFPFNYLVRLFQPFVAGKYQLSQLQLYVSSGTGYWGPPLRLGASAEISDIQLA